MAALEQAFACLGLATAVFLFLYLFLVLITGRK